MRASVPTLIPRMLVSSPTVAVFAATLLLLANAIASDSTTESAAKEISYVTDIEPIFRTHCFGCHQGAKQLGDYKMTDFASLTAGGESGEVAIVAGDPDASYLFQQIKVVNGHADMPKAPATPLDQASIDRIAAWIAAGAVNDSAAQTESQFDRNHPPDYRGPPSLPSVDVAADGKTIAVAGYHEVILLDADSGQRVGRLIGSSPRINSVRFSPDGARLAAAGGRSGESGEIQVWAVETGDLLVSKFVTYDSLQGVCWSPDGKMVAFGANDNVIRAIDSGSGEQVLFQGAHEDWVLDTVFTPNGEHLVSVARDMSCKLTEVATERFVDNVTSITPGALSGGLSSIASHPTRNEVVVGGSDGVPKVYRVFRQTARQIGDDANLIRRLPKLPGRIFSVAVSPDGSRIAAAATLDGQSEVRVWRYDFDGELEKKLKAILNKRTAQRTAEETKLVESHRGGHTEQLVSHVIDSAAVYAIAFGAENDLVIAAADGNVRVLAADGSVKNQFPVVDIQPAQERLTSLDRRAWNEQQTLALEQAADRELQRSTLGSLGDLVSLQVSPSSIELDSAYSYAQLVVTATMQDGSTWDATKLCEVVAPQWISVGPSRLIRALSEGKGEITVQLGEISQTLGVAAANQSESAVDYLRDVTPVLSRLGCNQGTCHGAQAGKNGFKLSLRGYDPVYDLRALTDEHAARRINAAHSEQSLMLRKPLGTTPHQGGVLMKSGDTYHAILERWIADGAVLDLQTPPVSSIEVFPVNPIVSRAGDQQQVRVVAHYADGLKRDVTHEAFVESGNIEVATTRPGAMLIAARRGEAPILVRYEGAYAATTLTVMGDREGYSDVETEAFSRIDELVSQKWRRMKIVPSEMCDDSEFLRRVYLDLTGLPPSSDEVRAFWADTTPSRQKREAVVDRLIASDAFTDFWTNKWADLLQVNRKFLGVEGSTAFRDWIRQAIAENRPYDQFSREILTATGSNKDNPPASYYKILRDAEATMENTTHLFLGIRFNCNKCHDHPFERWTQDQYYSMAAYFAQVGLEKDPASADKKIGGTAVEGAKPLYEMVIDKPQGEIEHPRTNSVVAPTFPFDTDHDTSADMTRREQLAAWMTSPDNPYFARSYVNRLWGYMFGVGLIEPIDDIRAGNPPSNPELLDYLTESFLESGFDMRAILRQICTSRAYQLSVETNPLNEDDAVNYSRAMPRRLPAEVIYDTVHALTGSVGSIPGVPKGTRAAALSDSGVNLPDGFLSNLGRPVRESACECERSSELQLGPVMALVSGPTIGSAIADQDNSLAKIVAEHSDDELVAEEIFIRALARKPTENELQAYQTIINEIQRDHQRLSDQLATAEDDWSKRRAQLDSERLAKLEQTNQQIAARSEEIKPERERLESERQQRIADAQAKLESEQGKLADKAEAFLHQDNKSIEWFPLAAQKVTSSTGLTLLPQADRSIAAVGDKRDKGIYTVELNTNLSKITGLRLEVLADPTLPSQGPGLAENGNFVLTEFIVSAASAQSASERVKQKIIGGKADFLQTNFSIEQTFDGNTNNQGGWAVSGATGKTHWATFKFDKPIEHAEGIALTVELHQFHNAQDHRIGRFRISATNDPSDELPLSLPEAFTALANTVPASRSEADQKQLLDHLALLDPEINAANQAIADAKRPLPPDASLVELQKRAEQLEQPIVDDPAVVQLRNDFQQSTAQAQNIRLTAAEDLTWALINSPAFLFNH